MPSGKSWIYFLYVNLGFLLYLMGIYYLSSIAEIKKNWSLYRCNPMYMPLSDDVPRDFAYCVQNMQTNYMGYLLQPITFSLSSITNTMGGFSNEINSIRGMFDKTRNFLANIFQSVFGVFFNLIIEFQRLTISTRDLMGKTIGIMATFIYILDGSVKTMNSAWDGPPGKTVRSLGAVGNTFSKIKKPKIKLPKLGKCFHPETKLKLENGSVVCMKDVQLGDVLENGSVVEAVMKINNKNEPENYRVIKGAGVNNEDIYVTGSHLVYDKSKQIFILVDEYEKAEKTNVTSEWFSCLITSNHRISIGSELFWDWEDYIVKL